MSVRKYTVGTGKKWTKKAIPRLNKEGEAMVVVSRKRKGRTTEGMAEETLALPKIPKFVSKESLKRKMTSVKERGRNFVRRKIGNKLKQVVPKTPQFADVNVGDVAQKKQKNIKNDEVENYVWKWWEERKVCGRVKWRFLEHNGPLLTPPYVPLPENIKLVYNGKPIKLSKEAEEAAGFYARLLGNDLPTQETFNINFMRDWRDVMTPRERRTITELSKCDFKHIHDYYLQLKEDMKNRPKEERDAINASKKALADKYSWCTIDQHKQRIANFRVEMPGLFIGRGKHPKQGCLKKRIMPEDIIINCSKDSNVPIPPPGHRWKEVRSDCKVSWLACWEENVQKQKRYMLLSAASGLKGVRDYTKYETARQLHGFIDQIRKQYTMDWESEDMLTRQRGVALYFIDMLALRAGNDNSNTVGCCSLHVEHIQLHREKNGKKYVVVFDFMGKCFVRYYNEVPVYKSVFENLELFKENKETGSSLFDRLDPPNLNRHLKNIMKGLTAKVFRTYNASRTLEEQLKLLTDPEAPLSTKVMQYRRANRAVAILCNHQKAVPKNFDTIMTNLRKRIHVKEAALKEAERIYKEMNDWETNEKNDAKRLKQEQKVERLKLQLMTLQNEASYKEQNKSVDLGTSRLNYLDPRITVAWCLRYEVPIQSVFNKSERERFEWAIDMATANYTFINS